MRSMSLLFGVMLVAASAVRAQGRGDRTAALISPPQPSIECGYLVLKGKPRTPRTRQGNQPSTILSAARPSPPGCRDFKAAPLSPASDVPNTLPYFLGPARH